MGTVCNNQNLREIIPITLDGRAKSIKEALEMSASLVEIRSIYVVAENILMLNPAYSHLIEHNYRSYAKIDVFEDFEKPFQYPTWFTFAPPLCF